MSDKIYRLETAAIELADAAGRACPAGDPRRRNRPDDAWLGPLPPAEPGAISFWTKRGLEKYQESGLRDWQLSVVQDPVQFMIAERPAAVLFEDADRIVCPRDAAKVTRVYRADYQGPRPYLPLPAAARPAFLRHHRQVRDWCVYDSYNGSSETFSIVASVGAKLGLQRIAVHHEILKPGKRSSWPHAHKIEEELVHVLKGRPDVWINGRLYPGKPGDTFLFPPDTGLAHTVLNNSADDVEMLVLGEQDKVVDLIFYPQHPRRNQECKDGGYFWEDHPRLPAGDHSGEPGSVAGRAAGPYEFQASTTALEAKACGKPDDGDRVFYRDRDLGRKVGVKRIALHHVTLPSGFRSSLPHAESLEEEFVFVLSGRPIAWINGHRHPMSEGDSVAFPSGTGILHTLINESGADVELIVSGEITKAANLCAFPLDPGQKASCGIWWEDPPAQALGSDSPRPRRPIP